VKNVLKIFPGRLLLKVAGLLAYRLWLTQKVQMRQWWTLVSGKTVRGGEREGGRRKTDIFSEWWKYMG
jgi:hypothetical protein